MQPSMGILANQIIRVLIAKDVLPKDASKTLAESKSDKSAQMILFRFSRDR